MFQFRRRGGTLTVQCPAKINLFLHVAGKRHDGYHNIVTLMQTVNLYDTIEFTIAGQGTSLVVDGGDNIPADGSNTIVRAIEVIRLRYRLKEPIRVRLKKRIPIGAGLGGGSSDCAGAILAMNRLFDLRMTKRQMADIGASVGSDVPFFFYGPLAVCRGRGEIVEPLPPLPKMRIVLAVPAKGNPTENIYKKLNISRLTKGASGVMVNLNMILVGILGRQCLTNQLESTASRFNPEMTALKRFMLGLFPSGVFMTGSGSGLYAFCRTNRESVAKAAKIRSTANVKAYALENITSR